MINNKNDLKRYLQTDNCAIHQGRLEKRPSLFGDDLWRFQIALRKAEYYANTNGNFILRFYYKYLFYVKSIWLGLEIPLNTFEEGLWIVHRGGICVSQKARIGKGCELYQNVTIGENWGSSAPRIGDFVTICAGAVIIGDIRVGSNNIIGANSVLTKDFPDESVTIAGNPAIIIKSSVKVDMRKIKSGYII